MSKCFKLKEKKQKSYRNVVFTWNNWTPENRKAVENFKTAYTVFGEEICPSTGTPHLQGYMQFGRQVEHKNLLKHFKGMHWAAEYEKSSPAANIAYCKKEMKNIFEKGTVVHKKPGKRNDIMDIKQQIYDGASEIEIMDQYPKQMVRYHRGFKYMRKLMELKRRQENKPHKRRKYNKKMEILIFWGESGSGKSKRARDIDPDLYEYPDSNSNWWDGYNGHKTILFEEYYGDKPTYRQLLKLTDGYTGQVPVKGGFEPKAWNRVIFTSNTHPDNWFIGGLGALKRRITEIREMKVSDLVLPDTSDDDDESENSDDEI